MRSACVLCACRSVEYQSNQRWTPSNSEKKRKKTENRHEKSNKQTRNFLIISDHGMVSLLSELPVFFFSASACKYWITFENVTIALCEWIDLLVCLFVQT